ncbi:SDR family NAD(P)-dependent oxidoreductase [Aeromicrobium phragmitis]|uniref:SDR family NAD(P)-dependent oxidoreductase n=1 Tax=Aeromicrobium phragmitis TaxID=2478914 RepID=A0A3L8PMY6_9ACTN|nr:NAD-dependent epimerase/dehydratase family protein [Aeromicrobium phragmitis]RLV56671.1 SDR family NAD(P)-dependent oxidoreductase [Aeromicrobium phragmitis]
MTAVIAGCGDLGTRVGLQLAAAGHRVVGLRRNAAVLPAQIEGRSIDLAVERPDLPGDTDLVVVATAAGERSVEGYRRAYVDALSHVLDAVDVLGSAPRVVLVSSTGVYAVGDGSWVDEHTPASAAAGTAAVLVEAEHLLRRRSPEAVALRLGGIYGPGRDRLLRQVEAGDRLANAGRYLNLIHVDDAASAIVHLLLQVAAPAPVYLGVDGIPATRAEIAEFIAGELGTVPPPHDVETAALSGKRCRGDLLRSTGFDFAYPSYRDGYRALIRARAR